eukprot:CAMPEP_0204538330 /NCGR_PEP_ID=MMETSP0661-20131031/15919_1 /ASSEMBLY_ACC=CAM_ASM_000606 /TAXON_ID=109239 /ORGANISM="Alexandrium margalefi, Strain AMGDE01CS-322" /LENGTH=56 /DNA_ID=CAMNT_0051544913 /DNA_START=29 /DNA_END=195 /DNA_ORIENTATION=+
MAEDVFAEALTAQLRELQSWIVAEHQRCSRPAAIEGEALSPSNSVPEKVDASVNGG